MAGPIAISVALSRVRAVTCPHCGFKKLVERTPKEFRVCPRCKRHYPDPKKR